MLIRHVLLLAFLLLSVARAASAPLVVNIAGDLWTWTGAQGWQQRTHWGGNGPPVLSPDGRRVAYASVAEGSLDTSRVTGEATNIWVLDLTTWKATRLTNQPAAVSSGQGVMRSTPAWSPDGAFLAWTQRPQRALGGGRPSEAVTLVRYAVSSGTARVIRTAVPDLSGTPAPIGLLWGTAGLVMLGTAGPSTDNTSTYVLDASGRVVRRVGGAGLVSHLTHLGSSAFLGSFFDEETFYSLSGRAHVLRRPGTFERLVAVRAPGGLSVQVWWPLQGRDHTDCSLLRSGRRLHTWTCEPAVYGGPVFQDFLDLAYDIAVSPDGGQVAYAADDAIFVHDGRGPRRILDLHGRSMNGMVWGPAEFRVP
ncbi:TolB family protein [Deinococcus apachensis]|uniref:TolB family protein n=1 Tax=Deinococcus apachensis TaxID=309886 RepID=UPI00036C835B|nr:PD40 domain-containing protein [Deinococcus apachensis]